MRRFCLSTAFLSKLAKHLAVLACLGIVGETSGRFAIGQMGIFSLVVCAALLHSASRTLQRRLQIHLNEKDVQGSMFQVQRFNSFRSLNIER
jgi:hypothetical protein